MKKREESEDGRLLKNSGQRKEVNTSQRQTCKLLSGEKDDGHGLQGQPHHAPSHPSQCELDFLFQS